MLIFEVSRGHATGQAKPRCQRSPRPPRDLYAGRAEVLVSKVGHMWRRRCMPADRQMHRQTDTQTDTQTDRHTGKTQESAAAEVYPAA